VTALSVQGSTAGSSNPQKASEGRNSQAQVPFRDSKLTRLLKDSLQVG